MYKTNISSVYKLKQKPQLETLPSDPSVWIWLCWPRADYDESLSSSGTQRCRVCRMPTLDLWSETCHWISTSNFWDSIVELKKNMYSLQLLQICWLVRRGTLRLHHLLRLRLLMLKTTYLEPKNLFEDTYQELHSRHKHCFLAVASNQRGFCYFFPDWP